MLVNKLERTYSWRNENRMSLNEKIIQIPSKNITNIFGEFDVHIKKIERSLGITVVARDDSIKIIGSESSTTDAVELFTLLNELAERGNTISAQNVNYGLALVAENKGSCMIDIEKDLICHTTNGKPIKPKTAVSNRRFFIKNNFYSCHYNSIMLK